MILNDDPRADWEPTPTITECEFCAWPNEFDIWDHQRTGDWEYEFTCRSCGDLNKDHGTREDRGSTTALASLFVLGILLALGTPMSLAFTRPTVAHLYLTLTGAALAAAVLLIAVIARHTQKDHS